MTYVSSKVSSFKPALAAPEVVLVADIIKYAAESAKSQRAGDVINVGVNGRPKEDKMPDLTAPGVVPGDSIVTWSATPLVGKRRSHRFTVRVRVDSNVPDGTQACFPLGFL